MDPAVLHTDCNAGSSPVIPTKNMNLKIRKGETLSMISLYLQNPHIVPVMAPLMDEWSFIRMRSYRLKAVLPQEDIVYGEPYLERILACVSITGQAFCVWNAGGNHVQYSYSKYQSNRRSFFLFLRCSIFSNPKFEFLWNDFSILFRRIAYVSKR